MMAAQVGSFQQRSCFLGCWYLTVTGKGNSYIEGLGWARLGWANPRQVGQDTKEMTGTY